MTRKILTSIAATGAVLVLGVPVAWGGGEPFRDHGDASQARVDVPFSTQTQPYSMTVRDDGNLIVRDHGDASQARVDVPFSAQSQPYSVSVRDTGTAVIARDHGDATQAKLTAQSAPSVTMERILLAQEARLYPPTTSRVEVSRIDSGREIEWPQVGAGLGIGILLALGLGLIMRTLNVRPFAH